MIHSLSHTKVHSRRILSLWNCLLRRWRYICLCHFVFFVVVFCLGLCLGCGLYFCLWLCLMGVGGIFLDLGLSWSLVAGLGSLVFGHWSLVLWSIVLRSLVFGHGSLACDLWCTYPSLPLGFCCLACLGLCSVVCLWYLLVGLLIHSFRLVLGPWSASVLGTCS